MTNSSLIGLIIVVGLLYVAIVVYLLIKYFKKNGRTRKRDK